MGKGRWHPSACQYCGTTVEEAGHISATGACLECGRERLSQNMDQLSRKRGPFFEKWYAACRAAFEFERVGSS